MDQPVPGGGGARDNDPAPRGEDAAETSPPDSSGLTYTCPTCATAFTVDAEPADHILTCPACKAEFFAPEDPDALDYEARQAREAEEAAREDEIDASRFKQVATLRRAMNRTRSLILIGVLGLGAAAVQLLLLAARDVYAGVRGPKTIGYASAAVAAVIGCIMMWRRAREIDRELAETRLPEPTTPPDFSTLSDGTEYERERWKKFDALAGSSGEGERE